MAGKKGHLECIKFAMPLAVKLLRGFLKTPIQP